MDLNLKDKVILVSGGSEGIGEAITRTLVEEGAVPFIAASEEEVTVSLINEIKSDGNRADYYIGDLSIEGNCGKAVQHIVDVFGCVDGLVNNAGTNDGVSLQHGRRESFSDSLKQNLFHYFELAHHAYPYLKKSRGSIVNIASKVAITGQGGTSGYAAAKGAQLALTREWAAELLPYGVRVNAVLPAEVMTPMYRKWLEENFDTPRDKIEAIERKIPLESRMTTTKEIADAVVFLLSSRSSHTTGQLICVDGGYVHLDRSLT